MTRETLPIVYKTVFAHGWTRPEAQNILPSSCYWFCYIMLKINSPIIHSKAMSLNDDIFVCGHSWARVSHMTQCHWYSHYTMVNRPNINGEINLPDLDFKNDVKTLPDTKAQQTVSMAIAQSCLLSSCFHIHHTIQGHCEPLHAYKNKGSASTYLFGNNPSHYSHWGNSAPSGIVHTGIHYSLTHTHHMTNTTKQCSKPKCSKTQCRDVQAVSWPCL